MSSSDAICLTRNKWCRRATPVSKPLGLSSLPITNMAHQSRWGWHPCDYATFLLLKELNRLYERALRQFAAWRRWQRKMPHNRVIRRTIVDAHGRKIGAEIVGPMPEPQLPPLFC